MKTVEGDVVTSRTPRVAFFADSFHEVNGVALTSRQLDSYARRRDLPFLSVHAGPQNRSWTDGSVTTLEIRRSRAKFPVETDLYFDPLFWRNYFVIEQALESFKPDVIHLTGPSDLGMLAAYCAHSKGIPLVASWHTNLHEFASRRLHSMLSFIPNRFRDYAAALTERGTLDGVALFYRIARVLLAPNPDLIRMLEAKTGKKTFLMRRGVDTTIFNPAKRFRQDGTFVLGFVGRLQPEKNVRLLVEVEKLLAEENHRFLIIGDGPERPYLEKNLRRAEFTGTLKGEALSEAYANMDLFLFPSRTDTYGNVVQEALASGVPAIVTNQGGPQYIVNNGVTGIVARSDEHYVRCVHDLVTDLARHQQMRKAARSAALEASWDKVFDNVYRAYLFALEAPASEWRAAS